MIAATSIFFFYLSFLLLFYHNGLEFCSRLVQTWPDMFRLVWNSSNLNKNLAVGVVNTCPNLSKLVQTYIKLLKSDLLWTRNFVNSLCFYDILVSVMGIWTKVSQVVLVWPCKVLWEPPNLSWLSKLVQTYQILSTLVQTCPNLSKTCPNLIYFFHFVQILMFDSRLQSFRKLFLLIVLF